MVSQILYMSLPMYAIFWTEVTVKTGVFTKPNVAKDP